MFLRVKGRGVLGRLVQSHINSRFQLLPIVGTKTHQSAKKKKSSTTCTQIKETASLKFHLSCFLLIILSISLSFAPLSKGVISKEYFSVQKSFSPLLPQQEGPFLKIQLTLQINKGGSGEQICMLPVPFTLCQAANKHLKWEAKSPGYSEASVSNRCLSLRDSRLA